MKFRGLMTDTAALKDFTSLIISLSKVAKTCIMRITKEKLYFIISEEEFGPRRPLVWCELPVNYYFKEYSVTGVTEQITEIYLEITLITLAKVLTTSRLNIRTLKVKLTNKHTPCLTIEMEVISEESIQSKQCVYDIPVGVISRKHWNDYEKPCFNDFHVAIQMPSLKSVKNIVERMKSMNNSLTVSASKSGRLILKTKSPTVSVAGHFPNLNVKSFAVDQENCTVSSFDGDNNQNVTATIDVKKFLMFLTGMQLNNICTVCNIIQDRMVNLHMEQPNVISIEIFLSQVNN